MSDRSIKILNLLKEKEISYGELSALTGIPKSALQRYATGKTEKIPLDRLEIIANALNTTPAYLMGWSEETNKTAPNNEDGLSPLDLQLMDLLRYVSDDQKKLLLAQIEILLKNQ